MRLLGWLLIVGGVFVAWWGAFFLVVVLVAIAFHPLDHFGPALAWYVAGGILSLAAIGVAAARLRVRILVGGLGVLAAVGGWLVPEPVTYDSFYLSRPPLGVGAVIGGVMLAAAMVVIHLGAAAAMKPLPARNFG